MLNQNEDTDFDKFMDEIESRLCVQLSMSDLDMCDFIAARTLEAIALYQSGATVEAAVAELAVMPASPVYLE